MSTIQNIVTRCQALLDENGNPYGVPQTNNKPHIYSVDTITSVTAVDEITQCNNFGRWGSGTDEQDEIRIDASTNSIQTIEYEHHEIHGGSTYSMFRSDTLATNDVVQLYWSTPASDQEQHVVFEWYGAGAVSVSLLENISYSSGGTAFTGVNHNRRGTPGTSNCTLKVGSNGALSDSISYTGGTTIMTVNSGAGRQVPGGGSHAEEFIFERELDYLLELTAVGNNIICQLSATWYEHTPKH